MAKFELEERAIFDMLEPQFTFEVPDYQREFSWGEKEIGDFLKDIFKIYGDRRITKYFLGATVLIADNEDNTKYYIIDGQQRMTTLIIFLTALKEKFQNIGEDDEANLIQKPYLQTNENKYKLTLNRNNEEFFKIFIESTRSANYRELVQEEKNDSNKLIISAYNQISNEIDRKFSELGLNDNQKKEYYKALKEIITKTNSLVRIIADSDSIASLIFETLNTRGKSLEIFEIIKNHIFWRAPDGDREDIKIIWNDILRDNYQDLSKNFFHSYITNYGLMNESKLFDHFKENIGESDYHQFTLELKKDVEILKKLKNPKTEDWDDEDLLNLEIIKLFRVEQVYFILLASKKKNFRFKQVLKLLVQMVFMNKFSQNLPFVFRKEAENVCKKILQGDYINENQIKPDLNRISVSLNTLRNNFFENEKDKTLKKKILILINQRSIFDQKKLSLEHMYTPSSPETFKSKVLSLRDPLGFEYRINQIHNLTLLVNSRENKQAADKSFEEKIVIYGNDNNKLLPTNEKLVELFETHGEFGIDLIKDYQEFLWNEIKRKFYLG